MENPTKAAAGPAKQKDALVGAKRKQTTDKGVGKRVKAVPGTAAAAASTAAEAVTKEPSSPTLAADSYGGAWLGSGLLTPNTPLSLGTPLKAVSRPHTHQLVSPTTPSTPKLLASLRTHAIVPQFAALDAEAGAAPENENGGSDEASTGPETDSSSAESATESDGTTGT